MPALITIPSAPNTIAVTGGTGSFGRAFVRHLLSLGHRVRVINRTERSQGEMRDELSPSRQLTYILTDIANTDALRAAFHGADSVVHAAALKEVGRGEESPDEFARVNIDGTRSVIQAALDAGTVRRLLFVSTDKAVEPINHYGATKMAAERLVVHANKLGVTRSFSASAIRGGNIWGSRASVAKVWADAVRAARPIAVNNPDATRFHLRMDAWIAFAYRALTDMHGGEIFTPKPPAWRLGDLADAFAPREQQLINPSRLGDKCAERLYSDDEARRTVDIGWARVIEPPAELRSVWNYAPWIGNDVSPLAYSSDAAARLTVPELTELAKEITA